MSPGPAPAGPLDDDPEAERRAASPHQPLGMWWGAGVLGLTVAAVLLVTENLRAYGYAVGVTMGVLALARVLLPDAAVGGLAVRSRWVDATIMALLGLAVAVLAATLRIL
ncbi:MAG TPA: DUF3017 domain-containing protein [Ornithinimicrobium sp.]|nr:DUF3017 domain-containing protein [Ornithinimicrobium sp.]